MLTARHTAGAGMASAADAVAGAGAGACAVTVAGACAVAGAGAVAGAELGDNGGARDKESMAGAAGMLAALRGEKRKGSDLDPEAKVRARLRSDELIAATTTKHTTTLTPLASLTYSLTDSTRSRAEQEARQGDEAAQEGAQVYSGFISARGRPFASLDTDGRLENIKNLYLPGRLWRLAVPLCTCHAAHWVRDDARHTPHRVTDASTFHPTAYAHALRATRYALRVQVYVKCLEEQAAELAGQNNRMKEERERREGRFLEGRGSMEE